MAKKRSAMPTEKATEVLRYIILYVEQNGYQPSLAEMASHFDVEVTAIRTRLKSLQDRGMVEVGTGNRAIKLNHVRFTSYLVEENQNKPKDDSGTKRRDTR